MLGISYCKRKKKKKHNIVIGGSREEGVNIVIGGSREEESNEKGFYAKSETTFFLESPEGIWEHFSIIFCGGSVASG
jgi:hypothetical protein